MVSGESGGITQHIRAYSIEKNGKRISFVDTPGHEAFTEMRARGANVTDIAVLVVAADDGVMPQTEEAISHARAADVPIVVALNKIDLPGVNLDKRLHEPQHQRLLPTEWGGDVEVVKTSATKGTGIDELLETLLTVAELHDYKANPNRPAVGTCLEAEQDSERGVVAKMLGAERHAARGRRDRLRRRVRPRQGDVRHAQFDTRIRRGRPEHAGEHHGFRRSARAPAASFYVLDDIAQAREIAAASCGRRTVDGAGRTGYQHVTLESLFDRLDRSRRAADAQHHFAGRRARLDRSDSEGAGEARASRSEGSRCCRRASAASREADVTLADASDAIIIGFNVVPDEKARALAERPGCRFAATTSSTRSPTI